uniref:Si:ch211-194m7.3 n=1 Tax=Xiphophorus couchianus TaxID=32473 RepID=A0A3B5MVX9_9TELE
NPTEKAFPHDKLQTAEGNATDCNTHITPQKVIPLCLPACRHQSLKLFSPRNVQCFHCLSQLEELKTEMIKLEKFDTMEVVKGRQVNRHLKNPNDLKLKCLNVLTIFPGKIVKRTAAVITGPGVNTQGEFSGNYAYGAWGRDPKPEMRKENWYWMVPLTSSQYANYIRFYPSLSTLIIGIASSNPTTNTIQGPNNVLYGSALYYNCYNRDAVCRFNLTSKSVTSVQLPKGTRLDNSNFCHLEDCYLYTDLDLATDESGVWVVYTTTEALGNLVLTKVEETEPPTLSKTWHTSVYKRSVTNTFLACGVLYATRYIDTNVEEVFYSFDTTTGMENFKVNIFINKVSPNIFSLNYNPVDQMLYAYSNAKMVSYKALFGYSDRYFS